MTEYKLNNNNFLHNSKISLAFQTLLIYELEHIAFIV